jgi:pyrroline-5-carboxylate reductase
MDQGSVGFIGGGQMARALIGGALEARFLVLVLDVAIKRRVGVRVPFH